MATRKEDLKKKAASLSKATEPASVGRRRKSVLPSVASSPQKSQQPVNNGNIAGQSNATPKSPKLAKAKAAAPVKVIHGAPTPGPAATTQPPTLSAPSHSTQANSAAAPPRRRPVIGLASRHFEAALTGAGVNATAAERRSRREKERERESGTNNAIPGEAKATPPSPKRDRGAKHGAPGAGPTVKIPSILQRLDAAPPAIMQRDALAAADGNGSTPSQDGVPSNPVAGAGRGGRRGRGRGRGMGAPIRGG